MDAELELTPRFRDVELYEYDYSVDPPARRDIATVGISTVARCLEKDDVARLFDNINSGDLNIYNGRHIGRLLRSCHLSRQHALVTFFLGVLVGMGEKTTIIDERNRWAVRACQFLADRILAGDFGTDMANFLHHLRSQKGYTQDPWITGEY